MAQRVRRVIPRRIVRSTTAQVLVVSLLICLVVYTTFSNQLREQRRNLGFSVLEAIRGQIDYPTFLNPRALQRLLKTYEHVAHVVEIVIVDHEFRIQASLTEGNVGHLWYDVPVDPMYTADHKRSAFAGQGVTTLAGLLYGGGDLLGYVAITLSTDDITGTLKQAMYTIGALALLGVLWAVLFSFRLAHTVSKPIDTLISGTEKIGAGNLYHQITVRTGGEIAYLADAFNQMTADLRARVEELRTTIAQKERMTKEMEIAARLQASMLPSAPPTVPGLAIAGRSRPAEKVGGDLFDYIAVDDRHLGIAIGDAAGKGIPGAFFMAQSCSVIRALAAGQTSPGAVLTKANQIICQSSGDSGMFITFFYAVIDLQTMTLRYANAGHNTPFLISPNRDQLGHIGLTGSPLGVIEDAELAEEGLELQPGDAMLLYTDGATDAMDAQERLFGSERLEQAVLSLRNLAPDRIVEALEKMLLDFSRKGQQFDDITLVALRREET